MCVYVCVHDFVCGMCSFICMCACECMYVYVCACVRVGRLEIVRFLHDHSLPYFLRLTLSLNLEHSDSARLAGQQPLSAPSSEITYVYCLV